MTEANSDAPPLIDIGKVVGITLVTSRPNYRNYVFTVLFVALATGIGWVGRPFLVLVDDTIIYLYVIVVAALLYSWGPAIVAAILSVLAYDFFFVPPVLEFNFADLHYIFTFLMMFLVGLLVAQLASGIRREQRLAATREKRTSALFALSRVLVSATDEYKVAALMVRYTSAAFGASAALLMPDSNQTLRVIASEGDLPIKPPDQCAIERAYEKGQAAGRGPENHSAAQLLCVPVVASGATIGVLAVRHSEATVLRAELREMLESFGQLGGASIAGLRLAEIVTSAELRARTEAVRSALLSSVSHDLRTPLGVLTEAATMLRDESELLTQGQRSDMIVTVCEQAEHMEGRIANLLGMTRLESGEISIKREWVPCEELIGAALNMVERRVAHLAIRTNIPADLPPIAVDPSLIEQLLGNLFENIVKYAGPRATVDVTAQSDGDQFTLEVADDGPGISPGNEERIFDKFFRSDPRKTGGTGLGLAICRAIAEIHGGKISASNRPRGGAVFRLEIPRVGTPPELPPEASSEYLA